MFRFAAQPNKASADLFLQLLPQLRRHARRVGKQIILVTDNGSIFTATRALQAIEEATSWLYIEWSPQYSSEQLNDIEQLWQHLEQDFFSRMLVRRCEDFIPAALRMLHSLRKAARPRLSLPRSPSPG